MKLIKILIRTLAGIFIILGLGILGAVIANSGHGPITNKLFLALIAIGDLFLSVLIIIYLDSGKK